MAHVKKYTRTQVTHLFKHHSREYVKDNVDKERIHLNYNLIDNDKDITIYERLQKRLDNVYCLKRKDVNIICEWIVTAPKTLEKEYHKQFFIETYNFLNKRYGKDNVINASVHMDEAQPHIHYDFVPIVYDKKKQRYKVNAKEVINRNELKIFHTDLQKHLENKMNMQVDILNEATRNGNKTVLEIKRNDTLKKIKAIETIEKIRRDEAIEKINKYDNAVKNISRDIKHKKSYLEDLEKEIKAQENKLNNILKDIDKTHIDNKIYFNNNQVEHMKQESILNEKTSIFKRKKMVTIEKDIYNNICNELKELYADNQRCNVLIDNLKDNAIENEDLKDQNKNLKRELQEEKDKNFKKFVDNQNLIRTIENIYKRYPNIKKDLEQSKEIKPGRKI